MAGRAPQRVGRPEIGRRKSPAGGVAPGRQPQFERSRAGERKGARRDARPESISVGRAEIERRQSPPREVAAGRGRGDSPGARARLKIPRFAIVAARFNDRITKRLVDGAAGAFAAHGVPPAAVEVHWVPGSFELPQAAAYLARRARYAAIVCLGVVIRGQTPHFEHVARAAAAGIERVALDTGVPATFGVVTALTEEQAWERAGGEVGNRGEEAAEAALEMAEFVARMAGRGKAP